MLYFTTVTCRSTIMLNHMGRRAPKITTSSSSSLQWLEKITVIAVTNYWR
jgi:hypothetical protein